MVDMETQYGLWYAVAEKDLAEGFTWSVNEILNWMKAQKADQWVKKLEAAIKQNS